MPVEDSGWGGTVDDGWSGPESSLSHPGMTTPPQEPRRRRPGKGGSSPRTIGLVAGAVVLVAAVVITFITISNNKPSPSAQPTPNPALTTPASTTPTTSNTTPPSTGAAPGLLSIAPFTGCVQAPASTYSTSSVVDAIACTTPDVHTGLSAQGVGYERFSDPTALTNWYSKNILSDNGIRSGVGDCASTSLIATAKGAQYCEGSFMDNTGVMAHQVLVVAPSAVPLTDGNGGSTTTACPGASSYTLLLVTSPSDNVGVTALACNGAIATAQRFEKALTAGTLDLHD